MGNKAELKETYLGQVKSRALAATEGPWATQDVNAINECTTEADYCIYRPEGLDVVDVRELHNAEFIAAARSDIPRLVAALESVLELHQPYITRSAWQTCNECWNSGTAEIVYPCPTVAAIHGALEEEQ